MRKIFANLKSVVALAVVAAMTLSVSCMYDDTALTKRVSKVEKDLAALTEKVNGLDTEAVESLINGLTVITGVTTDEAGNTVVTLSNGTSFTVLAECEGLQYRNENGVLEISADGETWVAVTADAACLVKEVRTNADGTATLVLADGTEFTSAVAEVIECAATRAGVYVLPETTKAVRFSINDAVVDINVMNQPLGWSATVEEYVAPVLPEEGEDDELDMGVLAAGGKEYVLNITAPAKDFAQAAKEGVVSVHFNTAAGACKVMKVEVTLAEVTLNVDANGNITIVNTIALEQEDFWGEKFTDFADFYIGVMPKALYEQNGDKTLINDYDDWDCEYIDCAATQRGSGLGNILELQQYEEGVYEKEVLEFTVEQLAGAFYPTYTFEVGTPYIIFLSLDTEMIDYTVFPVLTTAIMVEYTEILVDAQIVEGSEKWNDVTANFNLAGFDYFSVGWLSVAEVEEYMSYGDYASADEFIAEYIDAYGVMSAGALLSGKHLDATYNLSELASMSMTEWAPQLLSDTEYYFFVYPFNAKDEMEIQQHIFVAENLHVYGTFATAGLVAGEFEAGAEFEVVSHDEKEINVNVTFAEDVKSVMYAWNSEAFLDPEEAVAFIMDPYNYYAYTVTFDEYTTYLEASNSSYYGIDNPITLVMVAINSNGEYVVIQKEFKYEEPIDYEVVFTKAVFDNGTLVLTNDTEVDKINLILNPGLTSVVAGDYVGLTADWMQNGIIPWSSADALEFDAYNSTFDLTAAPATYAYYFTTGMQMNVAVESDVYTITMTDKVYMDKNRNVKFTFTGAIETKEPVVIDPTNTIAITEFKYVARSYELDANPETNGGDFVYDITCADGATFRIGLYWSLADAATGAILNGTYDYKFNALDVMSSGWEGFVIVSDQYYYESTLTVEEGKIVLNLVNYEDTFGTYVYEGTITK